MSENNGNSSQMEEFRIPDFIINLIGRLELENASLRNQLQVIQMQSQNIKDVREEIQS